MKKKMMWNKTFHKLFILMIIFLVVITLSSCKDKTPPTLDTPSNLQVTKDGLVTWDKVEGAIEYVVIVNRKEKITYSPFLIIDKTQDATIKVYARGDNYKDSLVSSEIKFEVEIVEPPVIVNPITIGLEAPSEVKASKSITINAIVENSDSGVIYEISSGAEYASINQDGKLIANDVSEDKIIVVKATSIEDSTVFATKAIVITSKPVLTQAMLDDLQTDKLAFEGYINIDLYSFGLFEKLQSTYTTTIKTAMDGTNWYAEYENGNTGTKMNLYYKNHQDLACAVGVSFMNDEEYIPMVDDDGNQLSWQDAGLYNNFKDLKVSDFTFNTDTWMYEFNGSQDVIEHMIASANPYNFEPISFSLILEEDEILGINSVAEADYTIVEGYKAVQTLVAAIMCGDSVKVPTISKYSHEDIHDDLARAIQNMQNLESYTVDYRHAQYSMYLTGGSQDCFSEYVTTDSCLFIPYTLKQDTAGTIYQTYDYDSRYGYKKINDDLYNSFYYDKLQEAYIASRAYESDFNYAKASFAFAPEIFRKYTIDEDTTTYYVDELMSGVASTFYYGVGNDIQLYGLFATQYQGTQTLTPYVIVQNDYIIESGFYYNMGTMYGIVEIKYSDFNETQLPQDYQNIQFVARNVPTSWHDLLMIATPDFTEYDVDTEVEADGFIKSFLGEDIELPFFGKVLGDTYGFGMTIMHIDSQKEGRRSLALYYDVPLDIDYTIDSSIKAVGNYLLEEGFEKNKNGEYHKGNLWIAPVDSSLDFIIYVWIVN